MDILSSVRRYGLVIMPTLTTNTFSHSLEDQFKNAYQEFIPILPHQVSLLCQHLSLHLSLSIFLSLSFTHTWMHTTNAHTHTLSLTHYDMHTECCVFSRKKYFLFKDSSHENVVLKRLLQQIVPVPPPVLFLIWYESHFYFPPINILQIQRHLLFTFTTSCLFYNVEFLSVCLVKMHQWFSQQDMSLQQIIAIMPDSFNLTLLSYKNTFSHS